MISAPTSIINPEEVYNKLVDIAGQNNYGLTMTYFNSLYLNTEFWKVRHPYGLSKKTFNSYVEFANYEVPWGLGWEKDVIKAYCKRNEHIWTEYEQQLNSLKTHGTRRYVNEGNILPSFIKRGDSRTYIIQRLKRDAPDIAARVINGEMSANAGMQLAGLKDKTVVVKCKADDFLIKAINNLEIVQIEKLVQDLQLYLNTI